MKIARYRKERGITQGELAERCDTTQQQIAKIEGGIVDPRLSTLRSIAAALGCEVSELFFTRDEFLADVRAVAQTSGLDLERTKLVVLNELCRKERLIPSFEPHWKEIEIAEGTIRFKIRRDAR